MARPAVTVLVTPTGDPRRQARCLDRLRSTLRDGDRVVVLGSGSEHPSVCDVPTPLVAQLHDDVVVTPHWLDRLADALDDPGVLGAGPLADAAPPGQALPEARYDDGRTSLRDFARLRAGQPAPVRPALHPLGTFCRLVRREALAQHGVLAPDRCVVVPSVFVSHLPADGCPDVLVLDEPGAPLLSASLIVRDEEEDIEACLAAVQPFVDEVVVYDTGSADRTRELAVAGGARVVAGSWDDDFGAARNRGLAHCSGRWVLVVDADEVVRGDPADLRARLRASREQAYAVPIRNLASGGVGSAETHHAHRLFRRADHVYLGRLHEQVVHARRGSPASGPPLEGLLLEHSGYTAERLESRDKRARNLALAEVALREAEGGDMLSVTAARMNLARAVYASGDVVRALPLLEQAWDGRPSRTARVVAGCAVQCAADLGDRETGLRWLERLEQADDCTQRVDVARARLLGDTGDPAAGLALVEALTDTVDSDGVAFSVLSAAALHAGLLCRLGRHDEAAGIALAALRAGVSDWHLARHLAVLRAAGRSPDDLAAALPEQLRTAFLAQCLQVPAADGHALLDALWVREPRSDVLAAASVVAPALPLPLALEWSARLHTAGAPGSCPLLAVARSDRPVRERALAAAAAAATFAGPDALPALSDALAQVPPEQEAALLAELEVLAPGLVAPVG